MNGPPIASGLFLIVAGLFVLLQTLVGDLPGRILSWGKAVDAAKAGGLATGAPGGEVLA